MIYSAEMVIQILTSIVIILLLTMGYLVHAVRKVYTEHKRPVINVIKRQNRGDLESRLLELRKNIVVLRDQFTDREEILKRMRDGVHNA